MQFDNTQLLIDLDAIEGNLEAVREKTGKLVMAVIKADAYGHGAVQVARRLEKKCAFFGVSSILEAMELRQAGISIPILILGYTPVRAFPTAVKQGIRPTIFHYDDAAALSRAAVEAGVCAPFHFAVDTGMSRIGFQATREDAAVCARIAALPGLRAEGLFSHFATADCADLTRARQQAELFAAFDGYLKELGVEIPIRHLDNSAGLMNFCSPYEMVRSGIVTYGMYPSDEVDPTLLGLTPALSWVSRVTHIKLLPPGRQISYGGTCTTTAPTMVATVPVGYADGYRRSLSGRFYVLIHGKRAPILGRVCMDQMMVDVTDIPAVAPGDTAVLLGEGISLQEYAETGRLNRNEALALLGRRVPRVYLRDGQVSAVAAEMDAE